jgi:hypothetical protein
VCVCGVTEWEGCASLGGRERAHRGHEEAAGGRGEREPGIEGVHISHALRCPLTTQSEKRLRPSGGTRLT